MRITLATRRELYKNSQGRNAMASVSFEHVSKRFNKVEVVHDITFKIRDQEFLVLVGPSGCGKSDLPAHDCRVGREPPKGRFGLASGWSITCRPKTAISRWSFRTTRSIPHMNVYDNMAFGLKLRGTPKARFAAVSECGGNPGAGAAAQTQAQRAFRRPAPARGPGPGDCARARRSS